MPTAQLLGFCALSLGFLLLMLGIVFFVIDKEYRTYVDLDGPANMLGLIFELVAFLLSWKWKRSYVLILLGASSIIAGIATTLFG